MGIATANTEPALWGPDAREFKPERWLGKEGHGQVEMALPGVWSGIMSFMAGPRACIGYKFALLEMSASSSPPAQRRVANSGVLRFRGASRRVATAL